ncbi:MAG: thioredoxin-disulfide reductase [Chloroflexi bacterium]|nr:thioredoxin-disulfide reductase [Chloroflexota bacterium]
MAERQIQVYGAPWCPDCKRAKQFLNEQRVPFEWIDVQDDPDSMRYVEKINNGKQTIPTILFPDESILVEPTNAELAEKLGLRPKAERTFYDLIIVGGGPAGLAAAIYTAREGIDTLIIERSGVGGQAAITLEIENYPGFPEVIEGAVLADRLRLQAERFGVEILPAQGVASLSQLNGLFQVTTQRGDEYCASSILVATGSTYRRLGVPGEDDFIGAGIHYCATCDGPFYKGKELLVVGGGNSGFQEGMFLTRFASKLTIIEMHDKVRCSLILQQKAAEQDNVEVLTNTTVKEFKGNGRLSSVVLKNVKTGEEREITPAGVFVFIGLLPNTEFLKETLDLDQWGFVKTGENLETNMEGVYAAGDCRSGSTKQVASAVGEGATAALMIRQYLERRGEKAKPSSVIGV